MSGVRKLRCYAPEELSRPTNLWEILERGLVDTFPIHTALWLFKNGQGDNAAFAYLPGPEFGYRARDGITHAVDPNNAAVTLQALAWFLCMPAYGNGHLPAGPTSGVWGCKSEGFLECPMRLPTHPDELPQDVKDLLKEAFFPLTDLPALTVRQMEHYMLLRFSKYSTIFGPLEFQLLRRASYLRTHNRESPEIKRDARRAMDRAVEAFDIPSLKAWSYDRERNGEHIRGVRCRKHVAMKPLVKRSADNAVHFKLPDTTSPYSPPYRGLPIFDMRPLYQEALRLVKQVPERLKWCPSHSFMADDDWRRLFGIVSRHKFSKTSGGRGKGFHPSRAEQNAAWEWVESIYGQRVRCVLYPSDRSHK